MKYMYLLVIGLLFGCASTEPVEVVTQEQNYKIILSPKPERPKSNYYDIISIEELKLICFDTKNEDIFNSNYFKMWNYVRQIERDNAYMREQIEINNSK